MGLTSRLSQERGFTLIELMLATLLLVVGVFGTVTLIDVAMAKSFEVKRRQAGTSLARELVEASRSVSYLNLNDEEIEDQLQSLPGTADSNGNDNRWTIRRGRHRYTIDITVCSVDDPEDGIGTHQGASGSTGTDGYCLNAQGVDPNPTPTTPPDDNPDDLKRVVSEVTWDEGNIERSNTQSSLVPNPGSAAGPQLTSLTRTPTGDPIVADNNPQNITFTGTTSSEAATVQYTVDGTPAANVIPSSGGLTSTFTWAIRNDASSIYVPDGSYVIGAQAFDSRGFPGAVRSLPVRLNRRAPIAPTGFVANWNPDRGTAGIADFEWSGSNEGDIVNYRVYRRPVGGGASELVCSTPDATTPSCLDESGPAPAKEYWVVAVDRNNSNQEREGAQSTMLTMTKGATRPAPPASVSRTNGFEQVALDWPSTPAGQNIRFYRVYRANTAIGDRQERTATDATTAYTDTVPDGGAYDYYVTSVDDNWTESTATLATGP